MVLSWKVKNETIIPVYRELKKLCFVLVDKSHGYCNDLNVLQRARKYFPKVSWIQLTRHPITNILLQIECSDRCPRSMMNVNFWVKGESNSDWRHQGVKSLKFHHRKSKDWLPVNIDKIILPDELEDDRVIIPDELEDDKVMLPDELEDDKYFPMNCKMLK